MGGSLLPSPDLVSSGRPSETSGPVQAALRDYAVPIGCTVGYLSCYRPSSSSPTWDKPHYQFPSVDPPIKQSYATAPSPLLTARGFHSCGIDTYYCLMVRPLESWRPPAARMKRMIASSCHWGTWLGRTDPYANPCTLTALLNQLSEWEADEEEEE